MVGIPRHLAQAREEPVPRDGVVERSIERVSTCSALRVTIIPVTIPGSLDRCVVDLIVHWSCDFPVTDWGLLREDFELPGREDFELPVRQC